MSDLKKFLIGLALLLLLWFIANFMKHEAIEADLKERSLAALSEQGYDWAGIEMPGRRAVVTGAPPSEEAGEMARDLVAGLRGVHTASTDYDEIDVVSPYLWLADSRQDGIVRLSGVAPSMADIASLVTSAEAAYPDAKIINEMRVANGAAPGDWLGTAKLGISAMALLDNSFATLRDASLMVEGETAAQANAARADEFLANASEGFQAGSNITVTTPVAPAAPVIPEEVRVEIDRCQEQINEVMAGKTINFRTASAEVVPQPNPIIAALSEVAQSCPTTRIRVTGHTDSTGGEEANQALSEARAQAVLNLLAESGVPASRMASDGYGASRPIADNSTPEGRSLNRRIEFTVQYAAPN